MDDILDHTFAAVRELKIEQQQAVARAVLEMINGMREPVDIPAAHLQDIEEAEAEIARGEVVTYEEMKSVFAELRNVKPTK